MKPIRVVVVDDHAVVRGGLEQLLNGEPDIEVEFGALAEVLRGQDDVRRVDQPVGRVQRAEGNG